MRHKPPQLILASGSPRRAELLRSLDVVFHIRPVDLDETPLPAEGAADYVLRLAQAKAHALAHPGELVLAGDTVVTVDGQLLGKPTGAEEAREMLRSLANREHEVLSGIALWDAEARRLACQVERTRVFFPPLSDEEIRWYIATSEPMDKAGAYAIQGLGAFFADRIIGSYSNVVGLPLPAVYRLFQDLGYDLRQFRG